MTVEPVPGHRSGAVPSAEELAAIVAVLESLEVEAAVATPPARSRWREAARRFDSESP